MGIKENLKEYSVTAFVISAMMTTLAVGYELGKSERPPLKFPRLEESVLISSKECEITALTSQCKITAFFYDKEKLDRYGKWNAESFIGLTAKDLSWEVENIPFAVAPMLRTDYCLYLFEKKISAKLYCETLKNTNSLPSILFRSKKPEPVQDHKSSLFNPS